MDSLVKQTREAFSALGPNIFSRSTIEEPNKVFRRSIYFVKDVNQGDILTKESIRHIRPEFGLEAKYYETAIGSKNLKAAKRGDRLTLKHFTVDGF